MLSWQTFLLHLSRPESLVKQNDFRLNHPFVNSTARRQREGPQKTHTSLCVNSPQLKSRITFHNGTIRRVKPIMLNFSSVCFMKEQQHTPTHVTCVGNMIYCSSVPAADDWQQWISVRLCSAIKASFFSETSTYRAQNNLKIELKPQITLN